MTAEKACIPGRGKTFLKMKMRREEAKESGEVS